LPRSGVVAGGLQVFVVVAQRDPQHERHSGSDHPMMLTHSPPVGRSFTHDERGS
jgi:hypothetical protein